MNSAQRSNDLTIEVVVIPVTYIDRVNHVTGGRRCGSFHPYGKTLAQLFSDQDEPERSR